MKTMKNNVIGALLVVMLFLLVIIFRDFLLTSAIQPLALLLWAVYRILASVHQRVYWIILILISLILIIRNLPPDTNIYSKYEVAQNGSSIKGFTHWNALLRQSLGLAGDQKILRTELTQILLSAISQSEHQDFGVLQDKFFDHELEIPENIYAFLLNGKNGQEKLLNKIKKRFYITLPVRLKKKIRPDSGPAQQSIDQTFTWIEKILEMNNENSSNNHGTYD